MLRTSGQGSRDSGSGSTTTHQRRKNQRSLPSAGYLFQEKVDVTDIIDPADMGLKVLEARRKGGLEKFYSPEKYQSQIQDMLAAVKAKKEYRLQTDLKMWGDRVSTNATWLKINKSGHI